VVLAVLGIAALLMAVNGTMKKVWADLVTQAPASPAGGGSTFTTAPAPSPAQPPAPPATTLLGMPGTGWRQNA